ncbi:hypothetical protein GGR24_003364 [Hansschlegelia beijingensis]|uniref:Uncharacterized protein n=1 Tax=Hansschlegelia beijingensis TaxID=1133344 RepID=A0A7W6D263_9HYPH|nr:hypothetical protein [Hansschlegelia beijingensis]
MDIGVGTVLAAANRPASAASSKIAAHLSSPSLSGEGQQEEITGDG